MRMCRIILWSVAYPVLLHFSTLFHKQRDFRKKKYVLIFSTAFVRNISHSAKNLERYYHKRTALTSSCTVHVMFLLLLLLLLLLLFSWRYNPLWLYFHSQVAGFSLLVFSRFLDHTQRSATVGRTPLDEWSFRRKDLYMTTHNTHNRQTYIPRLGFEPTISAVERPNTYALDRAATGTDVCHILIKLKYIWMYLIIHVLYMLYWC